MNQIQNSDPRHEFILETENNPNTFALDRSLAAILLDELRSNDSTAGVLSINVKTLAGDKNLLIPSGVARAQLAEGISGILSGHADGALEFVHFTGLDNSGYPLEKELVVLQN